MVFFFLLLTCFKKRQKKKEKKKKQIATFFKESHFFKERERKGQHFFSLFSSFFFGLSLFVSGSLSFFPLPLSSFPSNTLLRRRGVAVVLDDDDEEEEMFVFAFYRRSFVRREREKHFLEEKSEHQREMRREYGTFTNGIESADEVIVLLDASSSSSSSSKRNATTSTEKEGKEEENTTPRGETRVPLQRRRRPPPTPSAANDDLTSSSKTSSSAVVFRHHPRRRNDALKPLKAMTNESEYDESDATPRGDDEGVIDISAISVGDSFDSSSSSNSSSEEEGKKWSKKRNRWTRFWIRRRRRFFLPSGEESGFTGRDVVADEQRFRSDYEFSDDEESIGQEREVFVFVSGHEEVFRDVYVNRGWWVGVADSGVSTLCEYDDKFSEREDIASDGFCAATGARVGEGDCEGTLRTKRRRRGCEMRCF